MAGRTDKDLRNRIKQLVENGKSGISYDRLASLMRIKKKDRASFLFTLASMVRDGEIERNKKGKYVPSKKKVRVETAKLVAVQKGYGFAKPEGGGEDIFIPGKYMNGALPGDTVRVEIGKDRDGRSFGYVLKVLSEGKKLYTGKIVEDENLLLVFPDAFIRYPLAVKQKKELAAKPGDKVSFEVYYNRFGEMMADVKTVYGNADSAKVCADAILDAAGIPTEFSEAAVDLAKTLMERGVTPEDLQGREDLRDMTIFTIDGADAKDLDDAISLDETENGWRLGVHIADVSHYVKENSPLDKEAR
ncbi:MAG TPA: RNB domain-containing ribonuclease, partial [Candidatus Avimonas sp.]|nr:RNB domain-containing ribonuclease [Candidatus Avimonas sp.]